MKTVEVVLVAPGGYGRFYLNALLERGEANGAVLVGAVQPRIGRHPELERLLSDRKIPVFETLDDFYVGCRADLAVIASPMQVHAEQTCAALLHGSNVLCEKPACSSAVEAALMASVARKVGRFAAVGYQLSFSEEMLALKRDILAGAFGRPILFKNLLLRPRSDRYYSRNSWAGMIKDGEGRFVLDSVAHNAGSHNIHNMLFLLGGELLTSARPVSLTAELYRANAIENYDTAVARIRTEGGADILFVGSHALYGTSSKKFEYRFEGGTVYCDPEADGRLYAVLRDGTRRDYGLPEAEPERKLWACVRASREGERPACDVEAATPEVLCVEGMQLSMPEIGCFPKASLRTGGDDASGERFVYVEGLEAALRECYEKECLPNEKRFSWSRPGRSIDLKNIELSR